MNLHNVTFPPQQSDIQLIADYCSAFYGFVFEPDPLVPQAVHYRVVDGHGDWNGMSPRDTLTYLNRARDWHQHGRGRTR